MGLINYIKNKIQRYKINRILSQINEERVNFCNLPYKFRDNEEIVLATIENTSSKNKYIDIVNGFNRNKYVMQYCSERLRDSKEIALAAIKEDSCHLRYISSRLRDDKDIALIAVAEDGLVLECCSDRLKDDKEVALVAVSQNGLALEYCSPRLKDDKEVVLAAIQRYGYCLRFASDRLKNDKVILLNAIQKYNDNDSLLLYFVYPQIQALCQGQDPVEALTKAIESENLHAQLQDELPPTEHQIEPIKKKVKKI